MAFAHGASDLYSGILPFVIFYDVTRAGLPAWCQGALAFAWYLTSSIAQPLVGAYSDRRGRGWFLPASVALTAIGVSATPAAHSLVVLVGCVVIGGLGSAVMHPEAGRYSSLLGGTKRASAISIFQIGGQVGYGIGPLVAAALLAHAGTSAAFAMAIPGVIAALAVATVNPHLAREGVRGGTYCPSDGFIRPLQILEGYRRAAERLGARFVWDADVIAFTRRGDGCIASVRTHRDEYSAECVVNAAGAWAAHVGALAGVEIPVTPLRRQIAITMPTTALPATMPMTIDAADGFHLRVRDGRVLLLLPSESAADPFDVSVEPSWIERVTQIARERVPCLNAVAVDRAACCAGLYEMSPDGRAILGTAPGVPNFYLANGSSGHGVMHAPAIGALLTVLILDGRAESLDLAPFRSDRFASPTATHARPLL